MNVTLQPPAQLKGDIQLPTSKSITARALLIAALCDGKPQVLHAASCDDSAAMLQGLQTTGGIVDVGPAGTAMRFLTAYHAAQPDRHSATLDGDARMRQRPIGELVDALRQLGADIQYVGNEGYPPLHITGRCLHGGDVVMSGGVSSQFVSAVMMLLPVVGGGSIRLMGDIVSRPYLDMTATVMRQLGASVDMDSNATVHVGAQGYNPPDTYLVEGDWSAAAIWYALTTLLPNSRLSLNGLWADSVQGDAHLAVIMRQLGVETRYHADGVEITSAAQPVCCCSAFADMTATPDLIPSLTVLLCLLDRSFRLTGTRTLRLKESDRTEALRLGLRQLGYVLHIEADGDAVSWHGERIHLTGDTPPVIDAHGDHRIAMAFAPAAIRWPGLTITGAQVVSKSYPALWRQLAGAGFAVTTTNDQPQSHK